MANETDFMEFCTNAGETSSQVMYALRRMHTHIPRSIKNNSEVQPNLREKYMLFGPSALAGHSDLENFDNYLNGNRLYDWNTAAGVRYGNLVGLYYGTFEGAYVPSKDICQHIRNAPD